MVVDIVVLYLLKNFKILFRKIKKVLLKKGKKVKSLLKLCYGIKIYFFWNFQRKIGGGVVDRGWWGCGSGTGDGWWVVGEERKRIKKGGGRKQEKKLCKKKVLVGVFWIFCCNLTYYVINLTVKFNVMEIKGYDSDKI